MRYRKLGRTDIEVSVICQGCWSLVSDDFNWGHNDPDDSVAAIRASLDSGVNFLDTAEGYGDGESEEIVARALGDRRGEVILASKVSGSNLALAELKAACEQSLRRLKTDVIDLYQLHWPSPDVPLAESVGALEDLENEGKIRVAGVSNFGVSYMPELLAAGRVESNQLPYNLLWRPIEKAILPMCRENDLSVLCYSPIMQGLLAGKFSSPDEVPDSRARMRHFSSSRPDTRHGEPGFEAETFEAIDRIRSICEAVDLPMAQDSMAWLLARDGVASVIVGGRNAEQARENAAAGDVELPPDAQEALTDATERIKELAGDNCDMWQHDSRMER